MNTTSSFTKERSPQPDLYVKEETGSHRRPRGGNKSGTSTPSPSSVTANVSQAEYDDEPEAPRVPSRCPRIPPVKKCCFYIPDLRIATALICVFAISTSPSITWLFVRHSYSVQLTCYLDYDNKVVSIPVLIFNCLHYNITLSIGMGLRDIDPIKLKKSNSDAGGNKPDDGAGLRINPRAAILDSDTLKLNFSTARPSTDTEKPSTSTTKSNPVTSTPKSVTTTSDALPVNSTFQRVPRATYVYSDFESGRSEQSLSFLRLEDTSTSSSGNSALRIMALINFLIDLAFLICAIILLTKIFRKPHRKYIVPFMILALLSTLFSLSYALINFGMSKKEEGRFPVCVIFFTAFDVALWLYYIAVVNSYLVSIKRPRVHTEETEPSQSQPKD